VRAFKNILVQLLDGHGGAAPAAQEHKRFISSRFSSKATWLGFNKTSQQLCFQF
jgi:hypothetical protein